MTRKEIHEMIAREEKEFAEKYDNLMPISDNEMAFKIRGIMWNVYNYFCNECEASNSMHNCHKCIYDEMYKELKTLENEMTRRLYKKGKI